MLRLRCTRQHLTPSIICSRPSPEDRRGRWHARTAHMSRELFFFATSSLTSRSCMLHQNRSFYRWAAEDGPATLRSEPATRRAPRMEYQPSLCANAESGGPNFFGVHPEQSGRADSFGPNPSANLVGSERAPVAARSRKSACASGVVVFCAPLPERRGPTMQTVLERIEPAPCSAVFDGECAFCGIGDLGRPTWIFCADCRCQHGVCSACAPAAPEGEDAA